MHPPILLSLKDSLDLRGSLPEATISTGGITPLSVSDRQNLRLEVEQLRQENERLRHENEILRVDHEVELGKLLRERDASATQLEEARTEFKTAVRHEIEGLTVELQRERNARQLAENDNALLQFSQAGAQQVMSDLRAAREGLEAQVVELNARLNAARKSLVASAYPGIDLGKIHLNLKDELKKEYERFEEEKDSLSRPSEFRTLLRQMLVNVYKNTMGLVYDEHGREHDLRSMSTTAIQFESSLLLIELRHRIDAITSTR
ncbi:hypothetical protein PENSPDRAFT_758941 [Peniophora sp. CONT]|nr:hypothetical protein PENSPDRAFT_758941 [Peniophora sp. CONT]